MTATKKVVLMDLTLVQALSEYLQTQPYKNVAGLLNAMNQSAIVDMPAPVNLPMNGELQQVETPQVTEATAE